MDGESGKLREYEDVAGASAACIVYASSKWTCR